MKKAQIPDPLPATELATDLEHFDRLYYTYHQAVYANIFKMVSHASCAEDILQEVFLSLWENRQALDPDKVAGWLFVVSYNKAASYLKRKLKEPTLLVADDESITHDMAAAESPDEELFQLRLSAVEEAINHLPARKKEVFRLCRFEGKSPNEVASQLGISELSVKDYLKQSTQFIRQYIRSRYPHFELTSLSLLLVYMA
ncbi:RNA polymerase sigma factor [Paraflavitalea pollutisoli]|uniref:RNA polymerase sigma factor n=1 Tax=Paraflavitalea pollutisoli TaxID=3034143 RepID=UPI0023EDF792|nr:sigma-70 family RNA polymerase sigma factor [Paraflavitalea sp. H1-2-19X]